MSLINKRRSMSPVRASPSRAVTEAASAPTATHPSSSASETPHDATGSFSSSSSRAAPPPPPPLPAELDPQRCPFSLASPGHNLLLTLLSQSNHHPHPWIKCHKCGKWRKLPPTLSALSHYLPSVPLTLASLSSLSSSFLPCPWSCSLNHWDIDRKVCGAIQDYQDLVYEWKQVPLRFVRAIPRMDFYVALAHFLRVKGVDIAEYPCIEGKALDLFALYNIVYQAGGDELVTRRGQWGLVYDALKLPVGRGGGAAGRGGEGEERDLDYLAVLYRSYFFEWQAQHKVDFTVLEEARQAEGAEEDEDEDEEEDENEEREAEAEEGKEEEEEKTSGLRQHSSQGEGTDSEPEARGKRMRLEAEVEHKEAAADRQEQEEQREEGGEEEKDAEDEGQSADVGNDGDVSMEQPEEPERDWEGGSEDRDGS